MSQNKKVKEIKNESGFYIYLAKRVVLDHQLYFQCNLLFPQDKVIL